MTDADISHRFCVAPMMDGTDRHCRYFHRLLSGCARLYSEMITARAILHGDRARLLERDDYERPVALQLGGSEPDELARAAKIGADFGYDEINLNVGCPSDRVQSGAFGACLMKKPDLVAECVGAMIDATALPITVKCRIGVDNQHPEIALFDFVDKVAAAGCGVFIVHARKAWLEGLSPKENREVPPLNYDIVQKLKAQRPDLRVVLNGGIQTIQDAHKHLMTFDGTMLGRAVYGNPYLLADVDQLIFGKDNQPPTREFVVEKMSQYLKKQFVCGVRPYSITRHMLGLYHGARGARIWRRFLSSNARARNSAILDEALATMREYKAAA